MSKSFFFGLVTVYDWEWLWGRTAAQIELRTIDQPITVWRADDNKPKPGEKGFSKTAAEAARDYQRWLANKEAEKKKGVKVDIDTFLATGKKKEER